MTNLHRLKTLLIAGIVAILALSPAYAKEKFKVI
ncbi:iron ABC transporter substrate-binding protein, partial [Salmonella enterica subsp. enterica serovar Newport]